MIKDMVSVVLPTANRYKVCKQNIQNILSQTHKPLEIVVCDDSEKKYYLEHGEGFRKDLKEMGIEKYFYTARFDLNGKKDYGLARARNFGVIESIGEFLIFFDDRITPANPEMISVFVEKLHQAGKQKVWFFGDKGSQKQAFVENCSAIRRSQMVDAGMFVERIDQYGGMSRELIARFARQGFRFEYVDEAKAQQVCKSGGWDKKPAQIEEMKKLLEKLFSR